MVRLPEDEPARILPIYGPTTAPYCLTDPAREESPIDGFLCACEQAACDLRFQVHHGLAKKPAATIQDVGNRSGFRFPLDPGAFISVDPRVPGQEASLFPVRQPQSEHASPG